MIQRWSGVEIRALREAMRLSMVAFAERVGVSSRMAEKWEAAGDRIHPRPRNQEALDTLFATAKPDVKERFLAGLRAATIPAPHNDLVPHSEIAGPAVAHPRDGTLMVPIGEGIFLSGPQDKAIWLATFWIDVYPTTNAAYAKFVADTGHRAPSHWPDGAYPSGLANHPVVDVNWHDAAAYAAWAGKQLPSSLQWEKAARGPAGNTYPWGRQATAAKCNVRESRNGSTTPVDCYQSGASPYGVYDLCGNTWEWCATPSTPGKYELKGGSFTTSFARCAPAQFNDANGTMMADDDTGFRCMALVDPSSSA